MTTSTRCPCGSGDTYPACCERFHRGEITAPTAQALMRSRFSAFAMGQAGYLLDTWDRSTHPGTLELDDRRWTRLEIVATVAGGPFDVTGIVEFRAHYRAAGTAGVLHERSSFRRADGQWRYIGGEIHAA